MAEARSAESKQLSTAEQRRPKVIDAAIRAFALGGYEGTTIADIATAAGISPAYVFRLFGDKENLFIESLGTCFERIKDVLAVGAEGASQSRPDDVLASMGLAYAQLIADRHLLLLQLHALSSSGVPAVRQALQRGYRTLTDFVTERSGANQQAVQTFFAFGQLCHTVTAIGLIDDEALSAEPWAQTLMLGLRHFPPKLESIN